MPFSMTAVVQVGSDPAPLNADTGSTTAVFPIQCARGPDDDPSTTDTLDAGEVVCRGPLARAVLATLRAGDTVLVAGSVGLRAPVGMESDCSPVLMTIEADHIGQSLTAPERP